MKEEKKNKYTSKKLQISGITIYDSNSNFRRDFLKHHLNNSVDVVRFSYAMGKMASKPIIGKIFSKAMSLHYHYLHTNSVVLPIEVVEELIENSTDMAVTPCVCRVVQNKCDNPINTCFGINFYGSLKRKAGEKAVDKETVLKVARDSHERGLIAALESCVQPYQSNLCFCCACCCMPLNLQTTYGVKFVKYYGPYLPHFDDSKCDKCDKCVKACPVDALTVDETGHHIDLEKCLGCGLCESACPNHLGHMERHEERDMNPTEPSSLRVILSILYVYMVLAPSVFVYKLFAGSQQNKMLEPPRDNDIIR